MASGKKAELHDKINELIDSLQTNNHRLMLNDGRFPQIEIDLLRKAAIELYDTINLLHLENLKSPRSTPKVEEPVIEEKEEVEVVEEVQPVVEEAPVIEEVVEATEIEEEVVEEPVVEPDPEPEPPQAKVEETIAEVEQPTKSSEKASTENGSSRRLHERLKNAKISSIKKAISISKRYELQHLLFADNKSLYNKTLDEIDAMGSIEEAEAYFDGLSKKLEWDPENNLVQEFYSYIERRHMA